MIDLTDQRQFFADEIAAIANLRTPELIDALRMVPRERFLRPGPWLTHGEMSGPRHTADADPRHVYHNVSVAIDPARQLFNGNPGFIAGVIDALGVHGGARVLHIGAGLGYYTALLGHITGPRGCVLAFEVDDALAAEARDNLAAMPWTEVRSGDATAPLDEQFDVVLVTAGVTHPQAVWLDALAPGGRLALPLTASLPAMGANIGKGVMTLITRPLPGLPATSVRELPTDFAARALSFVAIYSGIGLRDDDLNARLGRAMMKLAFPPLKRLRRDAHEETPQCWLHGGDFCLSV